MEEHHAESLGGYMLLDPQPELFSPILVTDSELPVRRDQLFKLLSCNLHPVGG